MREVDFALSYPFEIPRSSFMFTVDQTWSLNEVNDEFRSKLPVLALGSNQSPSQLTRKYRGLSDSGEIPAERAILKNFDVVYAASGGIRLSSRNFPILAGNSRYDICVMADRDPAHSDASNRNQLLF